MTILNPERVIKKPVRRNRTLAQRKADYNLDKVQTANPVQFTVEQSPIVPTFGISQDPTDPNKTRNYGRTINDNTLPQTPQKPSFTEQIQGAAQPNDMVNALNTKKTALEQEITDLSERMANIPTAKIEAQKKMGIYEDQKALQSLRENLSGVKQDLLAAQDQDIELRELGKQKISDFAGTSGDYAQLTNEDLRKNKLDQLALSRTYSRLGDAVGNVQNSINDNISAINERANAEQEKIKFDINQKNKILDRVIQTQGNILSSKQKADLEAVKFKNELLLQDRTMQASQKKELLSQLAKKGVTGADLANYTNMSYSEISQDLANKSPANAQSWLTYTPEEAMTSLNESQYKRWQEYNKLDEKSKKEKIKQEAIVESTRKTIDIIDDLLENTSGMDDSVGTLGTNISINPWNQADVNKFRTGLQGLASMISLDTLKNLKATGATMGALNEAELNILQNSDTMLGLIRDDAGNFTGRSNLSTKDFKARLDELQTAALKANLINNIGRDNFINFDLKNSSTQELKDFRDGVNDGSINLNERRIIETNIPNVYGGKVKVAPDMAGALRTAQNTLKQAGIDLQIGDSFRSHEVQKQSFDSGKAGVAPPGTSFHEKGEAIDLAQNNAMKNEKVFAALRNAGLQQHPNEWWHWSKGEFSNNMA